MVLMGEVVSNQKEEGDAQLLSYTGEGKEKCGTEVTP